jgi:hypothetical protein
MTVYSLKASTKYRVRVAANNGLGPFEYSPFLVASTTTVTVPGPPGTPRVIEFTSNDVYIQWDGPLDDGGDDSGINYDVYKQEVNCGQTTCPFTKATQVRQSSRKFDIQGLSPKTSYGFYVVCTRI